MARALEVVGERWSLLLVRDAFFGMRRFSDFNRHLRIPRAVLTERLGFLVSQGVLARTPGPGRRREYRLTDKGLALWPVVRSLTEWGDAHYAPGGGRAGSSATPGAGAMSTPRAAAGAARNRCRPPRRCRLPGWDSSTPAPTATRSAWR